MQQDLLAPPKLTARKFAILVAVLATLAVALGILLATRDLLTLRQLVTRTLGVAALAGAISWAYARLMRFAARAPTERMPLIHAAVGLASMASFYAVMAVMVRATPLSSAIIPQLTWMLPLMFGCGLATAGWARRIGDSMHCPQCEYELGTTAEADAPIRCPECGTGWLGRLKKGRRVRSLRLVAAGITLAIGGAIIFNPIFYIRSLAPHLATPLLFGVLYAAPEHADTAWGELSTRPLSPRWTRAMAAHVVSRRGLDTYDRGPSIWFEKSAAAGKIPQAIVDRFYREGFRASLHVPAHVKAGRQFTAQLGVARAAAGDGALGIMFAGYSTGDAPAGPGRQDKTLWAHQLAPGIFSGPRDVVAQTLTAPDHPGELHVRAVYWVVYQPSFHDELAWQPDGTPAKPSTATWFERIELEKTILIE